MVRVSPIRTPVDNARALARISALWAAEPGTRAFDELEVLVTLSAAFESAYYPAGLSDPVGAIRFCMDQGRTTRKELEAAIGSRGRVSEVLNRRRRLTLPMIRRLHVMFGIPLESLVGAGEGK